MNPERHGAREVQALICCVAVLLTIGNVRGQNDDAPAAKPSRHYLFVVETSQAMKPRAAGTLKAVETLLNSGFNGQFRPGDTLDLWTFSDTLQKSAPVPREWTPDARAALSVGLLDFLLAQPNEKKGNPDKAIPEANALLQGLPFVTIVFITSGETGIHGSVCDGLINSTLVRLRNQQRQAQMPFVSLVRAAHGQVTDCVAVGAPQTLKVPLWPEEAPATPGVEATPPVASAPTNAPAPAAPEPKPLTVATEQPPTRVVAAAPPPQTNATVRAATPSAPLTQTSAPPVALAENKVAPTPSPKPEPVTAVQTPPKPVPATTENPGYKPLSEVAAAKSSAPVASERSVSRPAAKSVLASDQASPTDAPNYRPTGFLRQNGVFLLLLLVAGAGAAYCLLAWLRGFGSHHRVRRS